MGKLFMVFVGPPTAPTWGGRAGAGGGIGTIGTAGSCAKDMTE